MGIALAIFKALTAAWNVFRQEREIYNKPEMVKAKVADEIQKSKDRINTVNAILSNPHATPEDHAAALREIRLAHS